MHEMTRVEFIEQLSALERRLTERFELLERMMALGFDDMSDQVRIRLREADVVRENVLRPTGFTPRGAAESRD